MIRPIATHGDYNKLNDIIMYLGSNAVLKMNVGLFRNSDYYGRQNYHKEFQYTEQKSQQDVISMQRNYDYYMSIENFKTGDDGTKAFIVIGEAEHLYLKGLLDSAVKWFFDPSFDSLFYKENNKLKCKKASPLVLHNMPGAKYLKFEPTVVEVYGVSGEQVTGVRIYLSSDSNFVDVPLNKFLGFVNFIKGISMYMAASQMLAYFGRPEYGTNLTSFSQDTAPLGESVPGRTVQSKANKSLFDDL